MYTVRDFERYLEQEGYIMLPAKDPRSKIEPEASRVQTHMFGMKNLLLEVPRERTAAVYEKYMLLPDPKPCMVERTKGFDFPVFFDVDFKLKSFCNALPQTPEEKARNADRDFTINYTFGEDGPKEWFLRQQKVILRVIEEVLKETSPNQQPVTTHISVRTCYKFHVYAPELVVDEHQAAKMCKEVAHRLDMDREYQACPQSTIDIMDPSVYNTGLRMLGCDKGSLAGKGLGKEHKKREDRKLHQLIFGTLDDYYLTYPTIVGFGKLTLDILKKFSVILLTPKEKNVVIPSTWTSLRDRAATTSQRISNHGSEVTTMATRPTMSLGSVQTAVEGIENEEMILNATRAYVSRPEIKSCRILHAPSETKCLVLVPQACYFKGSEHTRTSRNQDTMWILLTKHRAELRCYACPDKPRKVLLDYNPPTMSMQMALALPSHATVCDVVYEFVENCMAASLVGRSLVFYKYDYDCNIWREDQFYIQELISNTREQLWSAFRNMNITSDVEEKARNKLLIQCGTTSFRNGVMDMVGHRLIKKWFFELGNQYFEDFLNQNRHLCIFSNGTWDWKRKIFRQGSPADCSLLSTQIPYTPFCEFTEEVRQLLWTYLRNFQPVEEELNYLLQRIAYSMDPSNREEIILILTGSGANGKTAFMNLIVKAMGDYAGTAAQSMFTQQPPESSKPREDIMAIRNSRVLCVSELTGTLVLGTMKVLSGHDRFAARSCHKSQIKFYLHFITFILTNETPKITAGAGDFGTWRRLVFAIFRITFKRREEDITDPETQRVGMTGSAFDAAQEVIVPAFLSLLVEFKLNPHVFPLPASYEAEQKTQENKNSVYIRFIESAIMGLGESEDAQYVTAPGAASTMLQLFLSFTEWMKMRRSQMTNIDYDVFNSNVHTLLRMRKIFPTRDVVTRDLVYPVMVKDAYCAPRRF